MVKEKKTKTARADAVPNPTPASIVSGGQQDWSPGELPPVFVVVRQTYGLEHRVSDKEYETADDPKAILERDFWTRTIKNNPDGTVVKIVPFEKRKHRIW